MPVAGAGPGPGEDRGGTGQRRCRCARPRRRRRPRRRSHRPGHRQRRSRRAAGRPARRRRLDRRAHERQRGARRPGPTGGSPPPARRSVRSTPRATSPPPSRPPTSATPPSGWRPSSRPASSSTPSSGSSSRCGPGRASWPASRRWPAPACRTPRPLPLSTVLAGSADALQRRVGCAPHDARAAARRGARRHGHRPRRRGAARPTGHGGHRTSATWPACPSGRTPPRPAPSSTATTWPRCRRAWRSSPGAGASWAPTSACSRRAARRLRRDRAPPVLDGSSFFAGKQNPVVAGDPDPGLPPGAGLRPHRQLAAGRAELYLQVHDGWSRSTSSTGWPADRRGRPRRPLAIQGLGPTRTVAAGSPDWPTSPTRAAPGHDRSERSARVGRSLAGPGAELYIDGGWRSATGSGSSTRRNPADGTTLAVLPEASATDVGDAVAAARRAFDPDGPWRRLSRRERARCLRSHRPAGARPHRRAGHPAHPRERQAALASRSRRPARHRRHLRLLRRVDRQAPRRACCRSRAAPSTTRAASRSACAPCWCPWNFPLLLATWKIAPALAMGNTVVVKPSPFTPFSLLRFAELVHEAGLLPPGVLNVVLGDAETGDRPHHPPGRRQGLLHREHRRRSGDPRAAWPAPTWPRSPSSSAASRPTSCSTTSATSTPASTARSS